MVSGDFKMSQRRFWEFIGISRGVPSGLRSLSMVFLRSCETVPGSLRGVSGVCQGVTCFYKQLQGRFEKFQQRFREFKECSWGFLGTLGAFQGCDGFSRVLKFLLWGFMGFKGVPRVSKGLQGCAMEAHWNSIRKAFQVCFRGFQKRTMGFNGFQGPSRSFQGISWDQGYSWKFQDVSGVSQSILDVSVVSGFREIQGV